MGAYLRDLKYRGEGEAIKPDHTIAFRTPQQIFSYFRPAQLATATSLVSAVERNCYVYSLPGGPSRRIHRIE